MDLVDIDQVLDNLELREAADENNKAALQRLHLQQCTSETTSSNDVNVVSCNSSKGFVGVSQVFNSLEDYRNDVESLGATALQKYDEECRPIESSNTHNMVDDYQDDHHCKSYMNLNASGKIGATYEADEDKEASNDIHKFTEDGGTRLTYEEDDGDDMTTATDSLTTSSSSNFSSGPSGLASTTDEHDDQLSPEDAEGDRSALLATNEPESELMNSNDLAEEPGNQPEGYRANALEDLAYGLSSISITTANSQSQLHLEPTVSSKLGNILEELSDTTSTSLLSQLRDDADDASQPIRTKEIQELECDKNALPITTKQILPPTQNYLTNVQAEQVVNKHIPITFGSTMDEISDTELDSMLQEMDIDDIEEGHTSKPLCTKQSVDVTDNEVQKAVAVEVKADEFADDAIEELEVNAADMLNADSFSQASTAEIRAESVQQSGPEPEEEDIGVSPNSLVSSYTSSESSLDGEGEEGEELEEDLNKRPQRPTTLNLPTTKMRMYANAGQTPPGPNVAIVDSKLNMDGENHIADTHEEQVLNDHDKVVNDTTVDEGAVSNDIAEATGYSDPHENIGKIPPIWVPDNMASACMQCHTKFTMIKRRHHCRACGKVLCSVCCSQKFKLEFLDPESRVCVQCYLILTQRQQTSTSEVSVAPGVTEDTEVSPVIRSPNPNNPMEYCSTIPPHRQVSVTSSPQPPSVIVPVGVLKKDGGSHSSNSSNTSSKKDRKKGRSVMFSDGIAPGSDLAGIEHQWSEAKHARRGQGEKGRNSSGNKPSTPTAKSTSSADATTMGLVAQLFRGSIPPVAAAATVSVVQKSSASKNVGEADNTASTAKGDSILPRSKQSCDEQTCFIPKDENCLPPIYLSKDDSGCDFEYKEVLNNFELIDRLQHETLKFTIQKNFFVFVKIVDLKCCMNRIVINFTTCGMHHVGNDEIVILLEIKPPSSKELMLEPPLPKDIFVYLNDIYCEAERGSPISELSYTSSKQSNFLGSREYGGFIFIRATFQCLQDVIVPENPFLIGILIHRYEIPWAKIFPLRLMLRLGAQYRYYPCPHISIRNRESVYAEIAQTIINFLADFRNYSYTLPCVRGMYIHMEDRQTTVMIPRNRLEDVIKAINNASDHILAFGGNFSKTADGHLVCMQNVNDDRSEMYAYSTQAINIQGQPRKVTGASFFVLNEALKSTSGLSGKCSIVEDGLMVQILPAKMEEVRNALRNQKDIDIVCGPLDAEEQQTEIVSIKWVENDRDFNIGVKSPIDDKAMEGVSSMRVHASFNYANANYSIRLTDIYILKFDEWYNAANATLAAGLDITRIAEQIARSASMALVPFLDLLAASGSHKISLRATLHQDNVCYEAGARGSKLPPLYMNALDNHLIPTLHNQSSGIEDAIILELIFYILNV